MVFVNFTALKPMLNLKKATLLLSICSMGIQSYASGTHQDSHANCDHGQCETSTADTAAPKKTIATVNGVAISNHELDKEVQRMNRSQRQMPGMAPTEEQKKQVLDTSQKSQKRHSRIRDFTYWHPVGTK